MNLSPFHVAYHRNGISGSPFHAVTFSDPDEGPMLGVVFDDPTKVAVFQLTKLGLGDIAFGSNSYRGDRYEPYLRRIIREWNPASGNSPSPAIPSVPGCPTRFDRYEIAPCQRFEEPDSPGKFYFEPCEPQDADVWTLYGHIPGQGADAIGDFLTREHAEEIYARITGKPYASASRETGGQS